MTAPTAASVGAFPCPADAEDAQYLENIVQRLVGCDDVDYIRSQAFVAYSIGYSAGLGPFFDSRASDDQLDGGAL